MIYLSLIVNNSAGRIKFYPSKLNEIMQLKNEEILTLRVLILYIYGVHILDVSRSHTTTQAAHLLKSWVRIPPGAWIFVFCECRVLSGRGLCDELITRLEQSYRLWCVVVCDLET
jgi:hypothetical protein